MKNILRLILSIISFLIVNHTSAQIYSQLPVLRTNKDTLQILVDNYTDLNEWIVNPELKPDVYNVYLSKKWANVKFVSDISSLSFKVKLGSKHDFLVIKGRDTAWTQIAGEEYLIPTKKEERLSIRNYQCLHEAKFSLAQRRSFYPFNAATEVCIISFEDPNSPIGSSIPIKNGVLNFSLVKEFKKLDSLQINELTDLLFNVGRTPVRNLTVSVADPGASCYSPHNGILFMSSEGIVKEYIEICFECEKHEFSSETIQAWETCEQKYDMLKGFFRKTGIAFGTQDR